MHISLTPQQEKWVQALIKTGDYASTSEVMRHAIRLLREETEVKRVKLLTLRKAVQKGIDEVEEGEFSKKNVRQIIAERKRRKT